jgi:hypothetical protein
VRAHLDVQVYIANGYQVGATQINPRLMFSEPLPREYIEQFPWPQGYDEWWLNGRVEGSTLKFWQNPNIDPPFIRDAAAYLNLIYPNGYDEPNCDLPSNTGDYGLNGEIKTCSIVSGENDINTPMPTPVQ